MQCYGCKFYDPGEAQSREHPGEPAACLVASEVDDPNAMELITNLHQTLSVLNNCPGFRSKEKRRSILDAPTHFSRQVTFEVATDAFRFLRNNRITFTCATVGDNAFLITVPIQHQHALEIFLS